MRKRDTAGHELAKGTELHKQRIGAVNALALAKRQEAEKKGKYTWSSQHRSYFLTTNNG